MSLTVPCPRCGPRPVEEFLYGDIPVTPDHIVDRFDRDLDRVFMRQNPDGYAAEAWFHADGCRRWTRLSRNRSTGEWITPD